VVGISL